MAPVTIDNHRRKRRVLAGLLLLLGLVSLLLLPFRGDEQAAPAGLAGIDPAVEPPSATPGSGEGTPAPVVVETGLLIKERMPTAGGEAASALTATETRETAPTATGETLSAPAATKTRETTPTAIGEGLSTPTATRTGLPDRTTIIAAVEEAPSTPTVTETASPLEATNPAAEDGAGEGDTATEFNAEAGTETPGEHEAGSNEPVGTTPATALPVTATAALVEVESTGPPTAEGTATPSIPVIETEAPVTATVMTSATGEAAEETTPGPGTEEPATPTVVISATVAAVEEITLTATPIQGGSTLPEGIEPTATPPRPEVVDPIMEHMAGERIEAQPDEPVGASLGGTPEAALPNPVSEQPDPDLSLAPGDVPPPGNLPTTGLKVGAPAPPLWVAGGVAILLLAVGVTALLKSCE